MKLPKHKYSRYALVFLSAVIPLLVALDYEAGWKITVELLAGWPFGIILLRLYIKGLMWAEKGTDS